MDELENIDDELDEAGIIFVTTEDVTMAKKHGVKEYPALVFFRNKMPLIFKGWFLRQEWLTLSLMVNLYASSKLTSLQHTIGYDE